MTSLTVCDASAVFAGLLDRSPEARWVVESLDGSRLAAPTMIDFEVCSVIRRHERAGLVPKDQASQAQADLLALPIDRWPYRPLAQRVWELRENLTVYDASYVALAELLEAPLVTLDKRLSRAPGIRCVVKTPPPA